MAVLLCGQLVFCNTENLHRVFKRSAKTGKAAKKGKCTFRFRNCPKRTVRGLHYLLNHLII